MSNDDALRRIGEAIDEHEPDSSEELVEVIEKAFHRRLEELRPFVIEAQQIEKLLLRLSRDGVDAILTPLPEDPSIPAEERGIRKPIEQRKAEIELLVRQQPGIKPTQIAKAKGLTTSRVSQILNQMEEDGTVLRAEDGLKVVDSHD